MKVFTSSTHPLRPRFGPETEGGGTGGTRSNLLHARKRKMRREWGEDDETDKNKNRGYKKSGSRSTAFRAALAPAVVKTPTGLPPVWKSVVGRPAFGRKL